MEDFNGAHTKYIGSAKIIKGPLTLPKTMSSSGRGLCPIVNIIFECVEGHQLGSVLL